MKKEEILWKYFGLVSFSSLIEEDNRILDEFRKKGKEEECLDYFTAKCDYINNYGARIANCALSGYFLFLSSVSIIITDGIIQNLSIGTAVICLASFSYNVNRKRSLSKQFEKKDKQYQLVSSRIIK